MYHVFIRLDTSFSRWILFSCTALQDVILHNVISHVSRNNCVIMGDFNHANIRWNSLDSYDDGKAFLDISSRLLPYPTCIGTYERR